MKLSVEKSASLELDIDFDHSYSGNILTPMRQGVHELSEDEKIARITAHFEGIMHTLGLDLSDDSLRDTPRRVAKMYVQEYFKGLNPLNKPSVKLFQNPYQYKEVLLERNIRVQSHCEHHFVPIQGVAHVAYRSSGKVVGLSKLNRIVDYYARRPQVQERLTRQIAQELREVLETEDVAVIIDAEHSCVSSRGIKDPHSSTVSCDFGGYFINQGNRQELMALLKLRN